ncbi:MAG: hypothetical protein AAGE65_07200, partial [Planctomycetota bacterium]
YALAQGGSSDDGDVPSSPDRAAAPETELEPGVEAEPARMTPERMLATLAEVGEGLEQQGPAVSFTYREVPVTLIYDEAADRMRLVSAIRPVRDLEDGMLTAAMRANFHSVLDVRYAISNGVVYSAFIHPLSDLSDALLRSAVHQVAAARVTFGTEYSSDLMTFGAPVAPQRPERAGSENRV